MTVKDIMSQPVVTVPEDALAPEIARVMQERDIGRRRRGGRRRCQLRGIVTESDFTGVGALRALLRGPGAGRIRRAGRDHGRDRDGSMPWRGSCTARQIMSEDGAHGGASRRRSAPSSTACSGEAQARAGCAGREAGGHARAPRCPQAHGGAAPLRPARALPSPHAAGGSEDVSQGRGRAAPARARTRVRRDGRPRRGWRASPTRRPDRPRPGRPRCRSRSRCRR